MLGSFWGSNIELFEGVSLILMPSEIDQRFPNFFKLTLAILETRVESIIGKSAIEQIKIPLANRKIKDKLIIATQRAEKRFIENYPQSEISEALKSLPVADLPSVKSAVFSLYGNPTDPETGNIFEEKLRQILPEGNQNEQVVLATKNYLSLLFEEMTVIPDLQDRLEALALLRIQHSSDQNVKLLQAIDQKLELLFTNDRSSSAERKGEMRRYTTTSSSSNPAYVVFLVDLGYHSRKIINDVPAINLINKAIQRALKIIVQRSTKGSIISPRYQISLITYGSNIHDVFDGKPQPIDLLVKEGLPKLESLNETGDTYSAFLYVEHLLGQKIETFIDCPAPIICHITSGEYPGRNPESVTTRVKSKAVKDGNILIENILIDDESVLIPIVKPEVWTGVHTEHELAKSYARQLFRMSSIIPETYRRAASESGFNISRGARMLFPGTQPQMTILGVAIAAMTRIQRFEDD